MQTKFDLIVVGGGFAGTAAAIAAARLGQDTLLIERDNCLGGAACNALVNPFMPFWTMMPEEFDRVMSVNLRGVYFLCRAVASDMITNRRKGHILLVNSSRGFEPAWSPYGISKWGLRGLTQGLAQTLLPYGIIVNGIAPGSTATPLIGVGEGESIASEENGVGRLATPGEIAAWARMLVSPGGAMVVGETILVSGGRGGIDIR